MNEVAFAIAKKFVKASVLHEKHTRQTLLGEGITFNNKDADGLTMPHIDSLVITLRILDVDVRRIVVDPGSLMIIIPLRVNEEM